MRRKQPLKDVRCTVRIIVGGRTVKTVRRKPTMAQAIREIGGEPLAIEGRLLTTVPLNKKRTIVRGVSVCLVRLALPAQRVHDERPHGPGRCPRSRAGWNPSLTFSPSPENQMNKQSINSSTSLYPTAELTRADIVKLLAVIPDRDTKRWGYAGRLCGLRLDGLDLSGLNFCHIDFTGSSLCGVDFRLSMLLGACLTDCNCSGADFRGADMQATEESQQIRMAQTNFTRANFSNVNLSNNNVEHAIFTDANLSGARLEEVHGGGALFDGANVEKACFTGAILTKGCLDEAYFVESADLQGVTWWKPKPKDAAGPTPPAKLPAEPPAEPQAEPNDDDLSGIWQARDFEDVIIGWLVTEPGNLNKPLAFIGSDDIIDSEALDLAQRIIRDPEMAWRGASDARVIDLHLYGKAAPMPTFVYSLRCVPLGEDGQPLDVDPREPRPFDQTLFNELSARAGEGA